MGKFPTWQWEAGDSSRRAAYLPNEKQFLITRNVPCRDRVRALDYVLQHKTRTEDEWLLPETAQGGAGADASEELRDVDDLIGASASGEGFNLADDSVGGIVVHEDFIDAAGAAGGGSALPDFG